MGFLASLLGWKKLFAYQIAFDKHTIEMYYTKEPEPALEFLRATANNPDLQLEPGQAEAIRSNGLRLFPGDGTQVAVTVTPITQAIPLIEHIRFWAFYQAKIIFNLGYNLDLARLATDAVHVVSLNDITQNTDCIAELGYEGGVRFSSTVSQHASLFTGEFYARGAINRFINTRFPSQPDEHLAQISGIALMQYVVLSNRHDPAALQVLTKTARNLVDLCISARYQLNPALAVQIPSTAYLKALGLPA